MAAMFIVFPGFVCLSFGFALSLRKDRRLLMSRPHFLALASLALPACIAVLLRARIGGIPKPA